MSKNYRQMKLVSGEEIICEVVFWPDDNDDEGDQTMVIRQAAELQCHEDIQEQIRWYVFRPYMMYISEKDQYITINGNSITSITRPHQDMMKQYREHFKLLSEERQVNFTNLDSDSGPNIIRLKPNGPRIH